MLLKAPLSLLSLRHSHAEYSSSPISLPTRWTGTVTCASKVASPLNGIVFELFEEVKKEMKLVPSAPQISLARHKYDDECEAVINEQINVEYNVSYIYHALYAYFDRDNIALKGFAKFFKELSEEERGHAEKFMEY